MQTENIQTSTKTEEETVVPSWYTPMNEIKPLVTKLHDKFKSHETKSYAWRENQLKALRAMLLNHRKEFEEALDRDLRQMRMLKMYEIDSCVFEIDTMLQNLRSYMEEERPSNSFFLTTPSYNRVIKEPYGVVCIISPWNYPISLLLKPAVGAIAAGNCVILKPSEVTENVAQTIGKLVPQYLDNSAIAVVNGGVSETNELLDQKFEYIFYTGNPSVGRIVMQKAAVHLTPVTLELGGKSPLYVDETFDWEIGIKRIIWGKFLNIGQTCVAPDYILLNEKVDKKKFCDALIAKIEEFYKVGAPEQKIQNSSDYNRIINKKHTQRLASMIEEQRQRGVEIVYGGGVDLDDKFVEPTIIWNPPLDTAMMKDEIFGPILPIIPIKSHEAAIEFINEKPPPLALYIYSTNSKVQEDFIHQTTSGGVTVNDCVVHIMSPFLRFGGIGQSGMGGYNGKYTFDTFTHEKPVMMRYNIMDLDIRYPPYTESKVRTMQRGFVFTNTLKGALSSASALASYIFGGS
jgi:aldehyde dehydrogenase (NAD+)